MAKRGPKPWSTYTLKPHDTITEGGAIGVLVSKNPPKRAWVDCEVYDRIVALHGTRAWMWCETTRRYVRLRTSTGKEVVLARLVLENTDKGRLKFADGDLMNHRRTNLSLTPPVGERCVPERVVRPRKEVAPKLPRERRPPRKPREKLRNDLETQVSLPIPVLPKPPPALRPMPKWEPVPSFFATKVQPNSAVVTVKCSKVTRSPDHLSL